jgi:hypothetical protein
MPRRLTRDGKRAQLSCKVSEDLALELDRLRGSRAVSECLEEALRAWVAGRRRGAAGREAVMAGRRERQPADAQAGVRPLQGPRDSRNGDTGDWQPEWPGQRPPFGAGNTASRVHGGNDERVVGPLAEAIEAEILGDAQMPQHVRSPAFARAVRASSRAEAVADLMFRYMDTLTPEQMTIPRKAGTKAPLDLYLTAEAKAAGHRSRLGLDPVSYARIAKDLGLAQASSEAALERLGSAGAEVTSRRLEIEAQSERDMDASRDVERPPPAGDYGD